MYKEKKEATASFKLDAAKKERFAKVCKANDVLPSQVLRKAVDDYLRENAQGSLL